MRKILREKMFYNFGSIVASFALMITALNVNTTCMYIMHQNELPKSAKAS
ncbi:MAG: cyclic lactone autoinducer peptide [Oscillospiraceae bacterium]